jgi:glycosyltransferase involved in cell wall biosynthesis
LRDRKIILFLSRFDEKKGLDLLLPAFAELRLQHPDTALVLAGSGTAEFVASLQTRIADLGIAADVFWAGFLTGADKHAVLSDADVFVLPSYSENFGIAVLEAMAAGLPVVVSDQVAVHTEVAAMNAGIAVPCTENALSRGLIELVRNDQLRSLMADNARCLAQQYTTERVISKLIGLYERIVA